MAKTQYTTVIQQAASAFSLPFPLLEAQVVQESSGKADAFRYEPAFYAHYIRGSAAAKAGAFGPLAACSYGLMQVMLETAYEEGFTGRPEELFGPSAGMEWGARKMRALWNAAGGRDSDYRTALAAYNGGAALLHAAQKDWPVGPATYASSVYHISGASS